MTDIQNIDNDNSKHGIRYTDEEKGIILGALVECDNSPTEAYRMLAEISKEHPEMEIPIPSPASIAAIRDRNTDLMWQKIAYTRGFTKLLKLMSAIDENIQFKATQEIINRAEGKPIQRQIIKTESIITIADLAETRKQAIKHLDIVKDVTHQPNSSSLSDQSESDGPKLDSPENSESN